uniref:Uncharacterized protein n=1 Tax=Anguilla anguilla TaxID=7936 RepID=A0A0E9WHD3_ANGAN
MILMTENIAQIKILSISISIKMYTSLCFGAGAVVEIQV